jgi:hypothetical protein
MAAATYNILHPNAPFVAVADPGDDAVHAPNATGPQIVEANRQHDKAVKKYEKFDALEQALKNQVIAACHSAHIQILSNIHVDFDGVSTLGLLTHLWTTYGKITTKDLDANEARMKAPYHSTTPISEFFDLLNELSDFAIAGKAPLGEANIVRSAYNNIYATGLYEAASRDWRNKPSDDQTLPNLRAHFQAAYEDLSLTTLAAGYSVTNHSANSVSVSTEEKLVSKIAQLESLVLKLTSTIEKRRDPPIISATASWCWTHGTTRNAGHTSSSCRNKAHGHKSEATALNPMGSTKTTTVSEKS